MKVPSTTGTSYDDVPYESHPFPQSHPTRLGAIATLFGTASRSLDDRCSVLEVGCAGGGNLLPIASAYPGSHFVGVDLSQVHIQRAEDLACSAGLRNVELRCMDLRHLGTEFGQFDYIIAHGVFSWIPEESRHSLMQSCKRLLKPTGLAYISYNVFPGWRTRGIVRDMMRYRASPHAAPADRLRQAKGLLELVAASFQTSDSPYGQILQRECELMRGCDDFYLLHDHLEANNDPMYFHEFMDIAHQYQLTFVGEADWGAMLPFGLTTQLQAAIHTLAADREELEQYLDFLRNRMFRQTILCHESQRVESEPTTKDIASLYVASSARSISQVHFGEKTPSEFRIGDRHLTTTDDLVRAAMLELREVWPERLLVADLAGRAMARIGEELVISDKSPPQWVLTRLADAILKSFSTSVIDISSGRFPGTSRSGEYPVAHPIARIQASSQDRATNLRHESCTLSGLQRQVLKRLDGSRDVLRIVEEIQTEIQSGRLGVFGSMTIGLAEPSLKDDLQKRVPKSISDLTAMGFLMS